MSDPVRTAVVGAGNVGRHYHLPIAHRHRNIELTAICDQNERLLRKSSSEYDIRGYTNLETMLEEENVESVHICTPPQTHTPIAEEVMSRDIPVLIEKPVTTSVAGLKRLIELSNARDLPSCAIHNYLFFPCTQETIARVKRGDIGDVSSVTMLFSEPRDLRETGRGEWVFDLPGAEIGEGIVHQVYLPLEFVDGIKEIKSITKQNFTGYDDPVDFDGLAIEAVDSEERIITIKILTTTEHKNELLIHGTDGELKLDILKRKVFDEGKGTDSDTSPAEMLITGSMNMLQQLTTNLAKQGIGEARRRVYDQLEDERAMSHHGHYWLISEYVESVRNGGRPPVTLEEALDTIRVLEAIGSDRYS